jgi:hypothetical protein
MALHTVLPGNGSNLVSDALARRPWWRARSEGEDAFNLWWGGNGQPFDFANGYTDHNAVRTRQLVNKFATHREVCTKTRLAVNLANYARAAAVGLDSLTPMSVVVNAGSKHTTQEMQVFKRAAAAAAARGEGSIWLAKPSNLNRGRGIEVFATVNEVEAHMSRQKAESSWVLQKYIERPLLLLGRKFDIRLFVLVTSDLRVYCYRDSYVRTASTPFDITNLADLSIHLTNDAVQKGASGYGEQEDANKLSFDEFEVALAQAPLADGRTLRLDSDVWPAMVRCVSHTFSSILPHFKTCRSVGRSFELYGCDFMITDEGKVLLIEVNTSPALLPRGTYLTQMLPRLIEELVQKAIDPIFPPPLGSRRPAGGGATAPASPTPAASQPLDRFELVNVPPPPVASRRKSLAAVRAAAASVSTSAVDTPISATPAARAVASRTGHGNSSSCHRRAESSHAASEKLPPIWLRGAAPAASAAAVSRACASVHESRSPTATAAVATSAAKRNEPRRSGSHGPQSQGAGRYLGVREITIGF